MTSEEKRQAALELRGDPKPLPNDPQGNVVWRVAEPQMAAEAKFVAFALLLVDALPYDGEDALEAGKRIAALWHGV